MRSAFRQFAPTLVKRYLVLLNYAGNFVIGFCKIDRVTLFSIFSCDFRHRPSVALLASLSSLFSFQGANARFAPICPFTHFVRAVQPVNAAISGSTTERKDYTSRCARRVIVPCFELRSQTTIPCALRSNSKLDAGGPEWARTTDLTIISRTL